MRVVNPGCLNSLTRRTANLNLCMVQWIPRFTICTRLKLGEKQSMQEYRQGMMGTNWSKQDILFVWTLENVPTKPWYSSVPVGKDILSTKLGKMCSLAGIEGRITNYSRCATSVTQTYETGVLEKVIQEWTGHRSLEALWAYERTTSQQHQAVSSVLAAQHTCVYNEQHSTFSTVSLEPHPNRQNISVSFQNLHGCTININNTPLNHSFTAVKLK